MKRVLVVGPGPSRVGSASGSVNVLLRADALAAAGYEVVVVDSCPSSALLWSRHRRYLEAIDAETIAAIVKAERIDAVWTAGSGSRSRRDVRDADIAPARWIHEEADLDAVDPRPGPGPKPFSVVPGKADVVFAGPPTTPRRLRPLEHLDTSLWLAERAADRAGRKPAVVAADAEMPANAIVLAGFVDELRAVPRAVDFPPAFFEFARSHERPTPDGSVEIHVLVMTDAQRARILGTFEHVEHAPVHADDAAAVFPSLSAPETTLRAAEEESLRVAVASGARGIVTVRWALGAELVMLGVTGGVTTHALSLGVATGVDVVDEAVRVALGNAVATAPVPVPRHVAVEEHVFPFAETEAADTRLDRGPFSTGSVLAIGETVERAYARALAAMGVSLRRPKGEAAVLLAGGDEHASALADVGRRLFALGFDVVATEEAARWLARLRVRHRVEGDATALVARRGIAAVVAATSREHPEARAELRRAALASSVPCFSTIDLVRVAVRALEQDDGAVHIRALDDWQRA